MELRDFKRYRGHLPVRMEREDTLLWLGDIIGPPWPDRLWVGKYGGLHVVRYRFGDVNEIHFYTREKEWRRMPLPLWMKAVPRDIAGLDAECWQWILGERRWCGAAPSRIRQSGGSILDI